MSVVFDAKVRRWGNSMAVLIPKEILDEIGAKEGDVLKLALLSPSQRRKVFFKKKAGIAVGSKPFERDERGKVP